MGEAPVISSNTITPDRTIYSYIILFCVSLIIGTSLRVSLLIIYPIVAILIAVFYRFRISGSLLLLAFITVLSCLFSLSEGLFAKYKLLSLFYMLPFLLLLFSNPAIENHKKADHLDIFIKSLTIIALVNDLIGLIQVLNNPRSDDSFLGIYSQFSISVNGLMLLNSVLFFFYLAKYIYKKGYLNLIASGFFLICAVLGFYGAGLIICALAFIFSFFRFRLYALLKTIAIALFSLAIVYFMMLLIKPQALEYNMINMRKLASFDIENGPRKLKSFYNYAISYPKNTKDFLFGSGPGTFNSRSAFMVGSPSYFDNVQFIKDDDQPYYFRHFAYTLWNEANTVQALYLDGFRNQPFSSLLAFLGEYGLIFCILFILLYYVYYRQVVDLYKSQSENAQANAYFRFFKFLIVLLPLLLVIDNFFEYPEVMLLILLGIKFSHGELLNTKQNSIIDEH